MCSQKIKWTKDKQAALFREAFELIEQLERAGHQAYIVGGSVRDALLRREIHDVDIATSATPTQVQALFPRTVPTGLKHGTVTVIAGKFPFELTTFRREGPYTDSRRPDYVEYVQDLAADLARRDFTINAMALNRKGEVVDPFGGQRDLERGVIRCVGQAHERFREDALRILRAIRFAAQLRFTVERETLHAMQAKKTGLRKLAVERITNELSKLLSADKPGQALRLLWTERLLCEIEPLSLGDTFSVPGKESFTQFDQEADIGLRWILFLRLCGIKSSQCRRVCRNLKLPRKDGHELSLMWGEAEDWPGKDLSTKAVRHKVFTLGLRRSLRIIRLAHRLGTLERIYSQILSRRFCHADWELPLDDPSQLALDGHTLICRSGRDPGSWIGDVQRVLLDKVVTGEIVNHPELLEKEWRCHGPHAP